LRIFKTKWFARFARRENVGDAELREAIARAAKGNVDATLSGALIKQRVAREGGGRSGGFRTIIAYRVKERGVFLYGFAKNERDNIGVDDLEILKKLGRQFLAMSADEIDRAIKESELIEVEYGDD